MGQLRMLDSLTSLSDKTVFVRVDSDVDLDGDTIVDDTRLVSSIDTIRFILEKGGKINIIGHLGRPEGVTESLTMRPIASWFAEKFGGSVEEIQIGKFKAWKITDHINLIENIRFFQEEEKNDPDFCHELSLLGDIYVNDAFAVSHRAHASTEGVAHLIPSYAGMHLKKEIEVLSKILNDPKRPLAILIGGAKIETKLPLVEKMHHVADYVLVGGEIAEQDRVLITVQHEKLEGQKSAVIVGESTDDKTDIDQKSIENFNQILGLASTIVWNGPVGLIHKKEERQENGSERGTRQLAEFIVSTQAYKVIGGGDTLAYLSELNLLDKFDFVSTGGGAMLEFLSGKKLPGIAALEE